MTIWWRALEYDDAPVSVEAESETKCFLIVMESLWGKRTPVRHSKDVHYPTWDEARAALSVRLCKKIKRAQGQVEYEELRRAKVLALTKPAGVE